MSGIFAYIGKNEPSSIVANGLFALRHRGGEAYGIAFKTPDGFNEVKTEENIAEVLSTSKFADSNSFCAIGETSEYVRTGSSQFAPPSTNNMYSAVCDTQAYNFLPLRRGIRSPFKIYSSEDLLLAFLCTSKQSDKIKLTLSLAESFLHSMSFAFVSSGEESIYAASGRTPLVIGVAENGYCLSSELAPLFNMCDRYILLETGEAAQLRSDKVLIYDSKGRRVKKSFLQMPDRVYFENDYKLSDEVFYCALCAKEVISRFIKDGKPCFEAVKITRRAAEKTSRIILVGEGASYNSALLCKQQLDLMTAIDCEVYTSCEFRYSNAFVDKNTLMIAVSERGETDNTLACVCRAKTAGAKTLAVTGSNSSALYRMCDASIDTNSDFSGGVSLRWYITSALTLTLFALEVGHKTGVITDLYLSVCIKMAELLSGKISSATKETNGIDLLSGYIKSRENVFATGILADFSAAREAADKMRSIAGVNCTAADPFELMNYSRDIIKNSVILAFITSRDRIPAVEPAFCRLKTLGAKVFLFTTESVGEELGEFDSAVVSGDTLPLFNFLPCVAGAYKAAVIAAEESEEVDSTLSA